MSLLNRILTSALGAALYLCAGYAAADVVVVVSPTSSVTTLKVNEVIDIFLGKASRFPNGERAVPLDLTESSSERSQFYLQYAGKSPHQMKAYWSKIIFTGKGLPPKEMLRSQEVKKLVGENPGLIGYMDRSMVDSRVRVVTVME